MSTRPTPAEWAAWLAQPRRVHTLSDLEAWIATDQPSIPAEAKATCPTCDGWCRDDRGIPCVLCGGTGIVTVGTWRRELRARIEAQTS